ncbi:MAG: hypothetical protein EON59_04125 [Alphaproteobacteria bacterium]|nr:MAG: hypothetical protein EON59_04125 [Alphaproteobacteria bacterium]
MKRLLSVPVLAVLLLLLTTAVYWPGLGGDFLFDDYPNIVSNPRVHAESLDWPTLKRAAAGYEPGQIGRPLATVSFAINHYLGAKAPWGYKFGSLCVHLLNATLVFLLLLRLFKLPRLAADAWPILAAFAISLLWAIHPLQVSSVLYVVQRMETLSLTFVLLALLAYLRGRVAQQDNRRGWPWLATSALLACVGLMSKETAVLFPVYALALELTVLGFNAARPGTTRFLKLAFGVGVTATLLAFVFLVLPKYLAAGAFAGRDFTVYERLLTQLRVLPMYLGQILLPLPGSMTFYYDAYPKSVGLLDPATTLLGGAFLLGLLLAAWLLRRRMPLAALGVFWFLGAHLLTSNVFNLELVFEHRNYFALLGVLLVVADLVRLVPMQDGPALKRVAVGALVLAFGFLGVLRAATWGDPLHLASDLVAKNPESARASSDLATLYVGMSGSDPNSPFFDFGRREFERGSLLPSASPLPEQGLILMAATTHQPVLDEWWVRLIHKLETQPISPQQTAAVTGLLSERYKGIVMDDRRLSQACQALLARKKQPAHLYAQVGDHALNYLHDEDLAGRMFVTAIERNPTDADYANRVLRALVADGHRRQARLVFDRGVALGLFGKPATKRQ